MDIRIILAGITPIYIYICIRAHLLLKFVGLQELLDDFKMDYFCFAFFRAGWSAASGWTDQPRGATEASVAQQDVILCITTTFMSTRI